jgi:hypothetical protein
MGNYIVHHIDQHTTCITELLSPYRRRIFNMLDVTSISIISFSLGYILGNLMH